jgi:excisionase family DNA binding protein
LRPTKAKSKAAKRKAHAVRRQSKIEKRRAVRRDMYKDSPVFSVAHACAYLDCGLTKFYELLATNRIKAVKDGDRTLVYRQSCADYLASLPAYNAVLPLEARG